MHVSLYFGFLLLSTLSRLNTVFTHTTTHTSLQGGYPFVSLHRVHRVHRVHYEHRVHRVHTSPLHVLVGGEEGDRRLVETVEHTIRRPLVVQLVSLQQELDRPLLCKR